MLNVMDAVRAEIVREGGQQRWARYSTAGTVHEMAAARVLGL